MKANFGLMPPLNTPRKIRNKKARYQAYVARALQDLDQLIEAEGLKTV